MKRITLITSLVFILLQLKGQYLENFDSYSTGTDSTAGWQVDCSGCTLDANDYFDVRGTTDKCLRAKDLDGAGVFETEWIDLSAYNPPFTLYGSLEKSGDMEGPFTPTTTHFDWVYVEYNVGLGWTGINDFRDRGLSDSTFYGEDGAPYDTGSDDEVWNVSGEEPFWENNLYGDSIKIRITVKNTANAERWCIDDLIVWETMLLSIDDFVLEEYMYGNQLKWISSDNYFRLYHSSDGANYRVIYEGRDREFFHKEYTEHNYYRLMSFTGNVYDYSDILYNYREPVEDIYYTLDGKRVIPYKSGFYIRNGKVIYYQL